MLTQVAAVDGSPPGNQAQIIYRERKWLATPGGEISFRGAPVISASRWIGHAPDQCEHESEIEADRHVLGIALRPMDDFTLFAARKLVQFGPVPRGSMRVNEPGTHLRGIFRGAYDTLHLHIPNALIAEYARARGDEGRITPLTADHMVVDPVIERLALALTHAEALGGAFGRSFAEGISLAITAQLFGAYSGGASRNGSRMASLSKWRLKRATDYIEANLPEPIGLTDVAAAAGLSRMHFAAQFRSATGLRPHEFLLRRRIKRAQELLSRSRTPLVEIALDVGFKTQAHFTTVFARFVGETPRAWRQRTYEYLDGITVSEDVRLPAAAVPTGLTMPLMSTPKDGGVSGVGASVG